MRDVCAAAAGHGSEWNRASHVSEITVHCHCLGFGGRGDVTWEPGRQKGCHLQFAASSITRRGPCLPAHGKGTGLEKAAESDVWVTSGGGPQRVCLHPIGKDRSPGCP